MTPFHFQYQIAFRYKFLWTSNLARFILPHDAFLYVQYDIHYLLGRMSIRPVHTWWLGVALFTPSLLIWVWLLGLSIYKGMFNCPFDWHGITHIYLPLFAALVGFTTPLVCLRFLRQASWRFTSWIFAAYLAVILSWGVIDIRLEHYQMGGHDYPNGPLVDGHRYYWHSYWTWYFLPYEWIERGIAA